MEIVIDIDENVFTRLFDNGIEDYATVNDDLFAIAKSIRNGTPLPKRHGRLIDADELWECQYCIDGGDYHDDYHVVDIEDIRNALTIIEAEGEE